MIYFLYSQYTQKLYQRLKKIHPEIELIEIDAIEKVRMEDKVVIEAVDYTALKSMNYNYDNLVILGDGEEKQFQVKMISKFQSYKRIESLILESSFPVYFLTQMHQNMLTDEELSEISDRLDIDYRISLNYNSNSDFSLYNHIVDESSIYERYKIISVITCFKDYLNPPVNELLTLINKIKQKGSVLIYSAPLKGPLDYAIMTSSDSVLVLRDGVDPYDTKDFSSVIPLDKLTCLMNINELFHAKFGKVKDENA